MWPSQSIKVVENSCLVLWKYAVNQKRDNDGNLVLRLGLNPIQARLFLPFKGPGGSLRTPLLSQEPLTLPDLSLLLHMTLSDGGFSGPPLTHEPFGLLTLNLVGC